MREACGGTASGAGRTIRHALTPSFSLCLERPEGGDKPSHPDAIIG